MHINIGISIGNALKMYANIGIDYDKKGFKNYSCDAISSTLYTNIGIPIFNVLKIYANIGFNYAKKKF
jgi:hypothetical protein